MLGFSLLKCLPITVFQFDREGTQDDSAVFITRMGVSRAGRAGRPLNADKSELQFVLIWKIG